MAMTPAERKALQRLREADQTKRRESLETKRHRAQALAEQLLASARDLAVKLEDEHRVSIGVQDVARYMLGLEGTEHVRDALAGKPVTLPPAAESVTPSITPPPPLNVTSNVTVEEDATGEQPGDLVTRRVTQTDKPTDDTDREAIESELDHLRVENEAIAVENMMLKARLGELPVDAYSNYHAVMQDTLQRLENRNEQLKTYLREIVYPMLCEILDAVGDNMTDKLRKGIKRVLPYAAHLTRE